jgi:hypothetical protein
MQKTSPTDPSIQRLSAHRTINRISIVIVRSQELAGLLCNSISQAALPIFGLYQTFFTRLDLYMTLFNHLAPQKITYIVTFEREP